MSFALGTPKSSSVRDVYLLMKAPKPKDPAPAEIEEEEKDVVENESPAECVVENAPEEPGLIDSTETTGKSIDGVSESVEENPVAAPQMDQVQPVVEEETANSNGEEKIETVQTLDRKRRKVEHCLYISQTYLKWITV